jgi:hypothetical protein
MASEPHNPKEESKAYFEEHSNGSMFSVHTALHKQLPFYFYVYFEGSPPAEES